MILEGGCSNDTVLKPGAMLLIGGALWLWACSCFIGDWCEVHMSILSPDKNQSSLMYGCVRPGRGVFQSVLHTHTHSRTHANRHTCQLECGPLIHWQGPVPTYQLAVTCPDWCRLGKTQHDCDSCEVVSLLYIYLNMLDVFLYPQNSNVFP